MQYLTNPMSLEAEILLDCVRHNSLKDNPVPIGHLSDQTEYDVIHQLCLT